MGDSLWPITNEPWVTFTLRNPFSVSICVRSLSQERNNSIGWVDHFSPAAIEETSIGFGTMTCGSLEIVTSKSARSVSPMFSITSWRRIGIAFCCIARQTLGSSSVAMRIRAAVAGVPELLTSNSGKRTPCSNEVGVY